MKKSIKLLTAVIVAALASVSLVFLVACGPAPQPETEYYKVTVLYPDNTPVNGTTDGTAGATDTQVTVQFCDATNENLCYQLQVLGADGTFSIEKNTVDSALNNASSIAVHLNGLPKGYTYSDNYVVNSTTKEVTITLIEVVNYVVTVDLPEGVTAPADMKVVFSDPADATKKYEAATTNGVATVDVKLVNAVVTSATKNVTVTGLPEGYKLPETTTTVSATSLTATITPVAIPYYVVTLKMPTGTLTGEYTVTLTHSQYLNRTYEVDVVNGVAKVEKEVADAVLYENDADKTPPISFTVSGTAPDGYKIPSTIGINLSSENLSVELTLVAVEYYEVTVYYTLEDGTQTAPVTGVNGLKVMFENPATGYAYAVDAVNGVAKVDIDEIFLELGTYDVIVYAGGTLPTDYKASETVVNVSKDLKTASVQIIPVDMFSITVLNPDGSPFTYSTYFGLVDAVSVVFSNPDNASQSYSVVLDEDTGILNIISEVVTNVVISETIKVTLSGGLSPEYALPETPITVSANSLSATIRLVAVTPIDTAEIAPSGGIGSFEVKSTVAGTYALMIEDRYTLLYATVEDIENFGDELFNPDNGLYYEITMTAGETKTYYTYGSDTTTAKLYLLEEAGEEPEGEKTVIEIGAAPATVTLNGATTVYATTTAAGTYTVQVSVSAAASRQIESVSVKLGDTTLTLTKNNLGMLYSGAIALAQGENALEITATLVSGEDPVGLAVGVTIAAAAENTLGVGVNAVLGGVYYTFSNIGTYTVTLSFPEGAGASEDVAIYVNENDWDSLASIGEGKPSYTFTVEEGATQIFYVYATFGTGILTIVEDAPAANPVLNIDGEPTTLTTALDAEGSYTASADLTVDTAPLYVTISNVQVRPGNTVSTIMIQYMDGMGRATLAYNQATQTWTGILYYRGSGNVDTLAFALIGTAGAIEAEFTVSISATAPAA